MLKTLIKKQLAEYFALLFRKNQMGKGKKKSKGGPILYAILFLYVGVVFFYLFYNIMLSLYPLTQAGLGWLYFALAGIMATALSVIGSVFMAQSQLFEAKDNELLLSMPIPPSIILFSRMISLYLQNFVFSLLIFAPTLVVYFTGGGASATAVVFGVLLLFILPVLSTALTCILGWLVALISSRMRNKNIISIVISLAFLAAYFYFYSKLNEYLGLILTNGNAIAARIKTAVYPIYQMGLAATGDVLAFVIFTAITLALFGLIYLALSLSFIKIATTKRGAKKIRYREKAMKTSSVKGALLRRELTHFLKSSIYLLNCGLGTVFLVAGAVFLIIKGDVLTDFADAFAIAKGFLSLLACLMICFIAATNAVTAPSISLEGKTLWLVQSLPIESREVLMAKLKLHMLVTAPAALFCSVVICAVLKVSVVSAVFVCLLPQLMIVLCGEFGLLFNLKKVNLDWSNETVVIKQSISPLLTILSNYGILLSMVILYVLIGGFVNTELFFAVCTVLLLAVISILYRWLMRRGTKILENL